MEAGREAPGLIGELSKGQHPAGRPVDQGGRIATRGRATQHEVVEGDAGHVNGRIRAAKYHLRSLGSAELPDKRAEYVASGQSVNRPQIGTD